MHQTPILAPELSLNKTAVSFLNVGFSGPHQLKTSGKVALTNSNWKGLYPDTTRIQPQSKMAFRYPDGYFDGYPRGISRPRNGTRHPSDDDRYRQSVEIYPDMYFDRLSLDPRSGPMVWDLDDEAVYTPRTRAYGPRFHDPTVDQFLATPMMGSGARRDQHLGDSGMMSRLQSDLVDDYVGRGTRREMPPDPTLHFALALKELHRKLEEAEQFYESFELEYEEDVRSIKVYASKEILEKLWTRKARGSNGSTNQDGYSDGDFAEYGAKFAAFKRTVSHALDEALKPMAGNAALNRQSARHQSMTRLAAKIATANRQIVPLLDGACKGQADCKALVEELQELKGLVDPETEKSKQILKETDYGHAEKNTGMASGNQPSEERSPEWSG